MDATNIDVDGESATVAVDGDRALKKTWLNLLPVEQVIELTLKLDEHAPLNIRNEIWPRDLRSAVFNAAVATIIESSGKGKAVDLSNAGQVAYDSPDPPNPLAVQRSVSPSTDVEEPPSAPAPTANQEETQHAEASRSATSAASATPAIAASTSYPASSTTSYGSSLYPYSYSYSGYPYAPVPTAQQPYSYPYPATTGSGSTPYSPVPPSMGSKARGMGTGAGGSKSEEDDLPSYEEMLVQALSEYNDPGGTAPKQLFQWMAAHYPLQANFRPSASQALQKAYKRGRFEKNKDGKYRLNAAWEGGNTSKRTTRRPQSYAKAVSNPSPSSHPPANAHAYPPYQWYSASQSLKQLKTQSQTPPPTQQDSGAGGLEEMAAMGEGEHDAESHRDAWEAAQSILQALNFGALLKQSKPTSDQTDLVSGADQPPSNDEVNTVNEAETPAPVPPIAKPTHAFPPPIFAGDLNINSLSFTSTSTVPNKNGVIHPPPIMAALHPPEPRSVSQSVSSDPAVVIDTSLGHLGLVTTPDTAGVIPGRHPDRVALQGSLALLAAQLADLASSDDDTDIPGGSGTGPDSAEWPSLADAASTSASVSASSALNLLEGLGADMFGTSGWAGLRGVGVDV